MHKIIRLSDIAKTGKYLSWERDNTSGHLSSEPYCGLKHIEWCIFSECYKLKNDPGFDSYFVFTLEDKVYFVQAYAFRYLNNEEVYFD